MSFPGRDNPYNFDTFLQCRDQFDYYRDDALLQRTITHYCKEQFSEASTFCPLACTTGLAELLDTFADSPELEAMATLRLQILLFGNPGRLRRGRHHRARKFRFERSATRVAVHAAGRPGSDR